MVSQHEKYMALALRQAEAAKKIDEVPVGAVIIKEGKIIARGHNSRESGRNPCAHAELLAIVKAAKKLGGWRLSGCSLYVTLEPCPMCAGAILNARLDNVYFGAYDPKAGAMGSICDLNSIGLNHRCHVEGGILADACAEILKNYFAAKRCGQ